jgi:hypothetical protein
MKKSIFCLLLLAVAFPCLPQTRVLFIGNSQCSVYDLPGMVRTLSASAPANYPKIETGQKLVGGASLKTHWEMGTTPGSSRYMIATGKWDYVIIQEIYNASRGEFENYATLFDEAIRKSGAKTILFATAGISKYYTPAVPWDPDQFRRLNEMQIGFGTAKGIIVAPAGLAWLEYLGPDPAEEKMLDLYHKDKGHPGYKGSYIYACLLYSFITGKNPAGLTSEFRNLNAKEGNFIIDKNEARKMQKAAWKTYRSNAR